MCCNAFCLTDCLPCSGDTGSCCVPPYCSENVDTAACNPELCSTCITGTLCAPTETPTPGSGTDIATNTPTSCEPFDTSCLPYAGVDASGNDIYQQSCGALVYADGTPATQADIAYNCGACHGTPCSPGTCGASDRPPCASRSHKCAGAGGGSGAGSAGSAGGGKSGGGAGGQCANKLSQLMNKFGSTLTSLFAGGKKSTVKNALPGQPVPKPGTAISSNTFLIIILVAGALLIVLAFGHKPTGD